MGMTYLITGAVLLVYLVLAWLLGGWLGLEGTQLWVLRIGLMLIGVAAAGAVIWYVRKNKSAAGGGGADDAAGGSGDEEVNQLIRDAEARLAGAKIEQGARIGNLPAIFLVGDAGSTKTSILLNSGMEPELLAGQVYQNNNVVSTRAANVWYGRRVIFVEAGGKLIAEPNRWTTLVRRLRPGRSIGKNEQAPRAAVVCFDAETFARPGAAEAAVAAARTLRTRLGEICEAFGINLPVYALFTKMDRLPFFADYVRNLSNEEAAQVMGATLPMRTATPGGVWAEEEGARLNAAFDDLFRSLANLRPEYLSRENDISKTAAIYEFPREFRKIRGPVVQYLVDLCRPTQLSTGPFLRGFYFSGVRPIIITDAAPAPVMQPQQQRPGFEAAPGATGMFRAGAQAAVQPQAAVPQFTGPRKVPQWLFVPYFFNGIVLADRVAMGASGASTKTNTLRRMLLASGGALCLILIACFTLSYFKNRALENRALDAARGISSAESTGLTLASVDSLRRLDTLRQSLETLTLYRREGAPLSYRWGLYEGDEMYPHVRRLYFEKFRQLLFGQTQAGLLAFLRDLPTTPGPEYGPTYETLKAYLITTSHNDKSTRLFLTPALMSRWSAGRTIDPDRLQLAQKQFDFYADELKAENPYSKENDGLAIERARKYLQQFAGEQRVYQFMLAEAGKANPPVNFNKKFPGSADYVLDNKDVAGAFTKGGFDFMKGALKNADKYFSGEEWVLGPQGAAANIDRAKLEQQIRDRYVNDFIAQWRAYIKAATVVKYAGLKDAATKLNTLSGNQSPLLALFWLASQNTAVDDPKITAAFQPIQTVVPPSSVDRYIAPPNQNYMNALVTLQTSLDGLASSPNPPTEAAAAPTLQQASAARLTTRQVAQAFRIDHEAHVETTVEKLLADPITYVEGLLRSVGPAELNAAGKGLCSEFRAVTAKYPFNPNATPQATLDDVNKLFKKPDGALWAFYESKLQKVLPRQGGQYVPNTAGGVTVNPAFVSFFTQAAAFGEMLYAGNSPDPHIAYTLKPVPTEGIQNLGLRLDGQSLSYTAGTAPAAKQFTWQGTGAHGVKATVKFGAGPDLTWSSSEGLWAVFHFFDKAERWLPAGNAHSLDWIIRIGKEEVKLESGNPLTVRFELDMAGGPPVFQKGWLSRLACVSEVAKP